MITNHIDFRLLNVNIYSIYNYLTFVLKLKINFSIFIIVI